MPASLSAAQIAQYQRDGFLFPVDCLTPQEVRHFRVVLAAGCRFAARADVDSPGMSRCDGLPYVAGIQSAGEDRRLGKAHLTVQMGGVAAAIEAYRTVPTPNVIILETEGASDILAGLDELATVCDPGTRVVVMPGDSAAGLISSIL